MAVDGASNGNTASSTETIHFDLDPPTVTLTPVIVTNSSPSNYSFTELTEPLPAVFTVHITFSERTTWSHRLSELSSTVDTVDGKNVVVKYGHSGGTTNYTTGGRFRVTALKTGAVKDATGNLNAMITLDVEIPSKSGFQLAFLTLDLPSPLARFPNLASSFLFFFPDRLSI